MSSRTIPSLSNIDLEAKKDSIWYILDSDSLKPAEIERFPKKLFLFIPFILTLIVVCTLLGMRFSVVRFGMYDVCTPGTIRFEVYDRSEYQECIRGNWETIKCPLGYLLDTNNKRCGRSFFATSARHTTVCIPGDKEANLRVEAEYFECVDGTHWELRKCPNEEVFDAREKTCNSPNELLKINAMN